MVAWRSEVASFFKGGKARGWLLFEGTAEGDEVVLASSRPMSSMGSRCHELKINDEDVTWRIIYRIDEDAIIILEIFPKKTGKTPKKIDTCKRRLAQYDS